MRLRATLLVFALVLAPGAHAGTQCFDGDGLIGKAGDQDGGERPSLGAHTIIKIQSGHFPEAQVEDDKICRALPDDVEGLVCAGRHLHLIAGTL